MKITFTTKGPREEAQKKIEACLRQVRSDLELALAFYIEPVQIVVTTDVSGLKE